MSHFRLLSGFVIHFSCTFSTCSGSFSLGETVPVVVKRSGQHLDLFDFVFRYHPKILGCEEGLSKDNVCYQVVNGDDEVCSCQGKDASCKNTPVKGAWWVCRNLWYIRFPKLLFSDTGHITWWLDDAPTTTLATTIAPDLNIYSLAFYLSEGYVSDENDSSKNLTVNSFVNCSAITACMYSIQIYNFADDYFTVFVGDDK